jgi:hypothetical protein
MSHFKFTPHDVCSHYGNWQKKNEKNYIDRSAHIPSAAKLKILKKKALPSDNV